MALSDTEAGVAWLENFSPLDRYLAKRLLDAFVLDSWSPARVSLSELIADELRAVRDDGAVWLLPAMDSGDIRVSNGLPKNERLSAFDNFDPGMSIPSMPGSEGLIGHLLRDFQGAGVLSSSASITELRERRVRTIIVVSDTIETGGQVAKYVQALFRNRTLKSWRSFRWIRLVVLAYAVSPEGERVIMHNPHVDSLRYVRQAPTIRHLPWAGSEIEAALDLCIRYGWGAAPLGYGDHAGLFGIQERLPNTIPRIFRQNGAEWASLFTGAGGRQVPGSIAREIAQSPGLPVAHDEIVAAVRQERLAVSIRKQQRESNRDILAVLALLRASPDRAQILGSALDLTQDQVEVLLNYLKSQRWIDEGLNVTDRGIAELAAGKRKPRRVEPRRMIENSSAYYPKSLR
jgi:hypothetical protein